MDYKVYISKIIKLDGVSEQDVFSAIEIPPTSDLGDYSLPCFKFSKILRCAPVKIAERVASEFESDKYISEASAVNGYVNFKINGAALAQDTLSEIIAKGDAYGSSDEGRGKTVCIDYSSVNIAKPFHIGHLSTTALGGALYKLFNFLGYKAVGINHLGDYGTQFGKLIYAFKAWGDRDTVERCGVKELSRLYVKYHEEAEAHPEMDDVARSYFKLIENGDAECNELYEWFKRLTLAEVEKIYEMLNITFDSYCGERFYTDKMQPVIDKLRAKGLLVESEGAQIVDLSEYNMPPCLILRSDGASLYATRDLATAYYRKQTYNFDKCLYVVAYQQNLHFKQVFKVLELLGEDWAKDLIHVSYGMVSLEEGSMSTRKGNIVLLEDVINKCIEKSYDVIQSKNPDLENKNEAARLVGTGAVIFGALYNSKIKDMVFSYDKVLNFEGETGPYVQYTCARANSVLAKSGLSSFNATSCGELLPQEFELVKALSSFNGVLKEAVKNYEPCYVARYAVDLAQKYNKFYFDCKILAADTDAARNFRLTLTKATLQTLTNALRLLGIGVPEKM